jgi:hypothetical protein
MPPPLKLLTYGCRAIGCRPAPVSLKPQRVLSSIVTARPAGLARQSVSGRGVEATTIARRRQQNRRRMGKERLDQDPYSQMVD